MAGSLLEAAILTVNLLHGAHLDAIARLPPVQREQALARENRYYSDEVAAVDCSSAPPCVYPTDSGRCATLSIGGGRRLLSDGVAVDYGGARWNAQDANLGWHFDPQSLVIGDDDVAEVDVRAGERPWFDPARKIRAEFCARERFARGDEINMRFKVWLDPSSVIAGLDWVIIAQVHQADLHYGDGAYVQASPVFALSLVPGPDGDRLAVSGETSLGSMRRPDLDPATGAQKSGPEGLKWIAEFAPNRRIGRLARFSRGEWHNIEFRFRDGHGENGSVFVALDGAVLADESAIATGYGYVEDLRDVAFAGGPQLTGSYPKFGLYAGMFDNPPPPEAHVRLRFKEVHLAP